MIPDAWFILFLVSTMPVRWPCQPSLLFISFLLNIMTDDIHVACAMGVRIGAFYTYIESFHRCLAFSCFTS